MDYGSSNISGIHICRLANLQKHREQISPAQRTSSHMRAAPTPSELPASQARPSLCAAPGSVASAEYIAGVEAACQWLEGQTLTEEEQRQGISWGRTCPQTFAWTIRLLNRTGYLSNDSQKLRIVTAQLDECRKARNDLITQLGRPGGVESADLGRRAGPPNKQAERPEASA